MSVLTRALRAVWDEINKPESYVPGDEFQSFVRKNLFPDSHYILINKTHDYTANKRDFVESSKEPDFKFKTRGSGKEFYVEVKYRSKFHDGVIDWCKPFQLKRYQTINNKIPVYVVIGIGGQPKAPYQISLIPMEHIRFQRLYPTLLKKFTVSTNRFITEKDLLTVFV
jgi:hypothetical protein